MESTLGFGAAWFLGLSVGLTACTVSCLPFMGTWVLGRASGGAVALGDAGAFIGGRVAGYTLLGMAAGLLGDLILRAVGGGIGHFWIGISAGVAALMLIREDGRRRPCGPLRDERLPPVLLGAALAMVPCAPLASLVATAASSGSGLAGAGLGLAFGLGAAVTPLFLLLPAVGALGGALRRSQPWLGRWLRLSGALILAAVALQELTAGWLMATARLP